MNKYDDPPWDPDNPLHVLIPISKLYCSRGGCCILNSVPLELSFERILHKVQGQTIGPTGQPFKIMIFSPGDTSFLEGNNPGILYTGGCSRATTFGGCDINKSAFYLQSTHFKISILSTYPHFVNACLGKKLEGINIYST